MTHPNISSNKENRAKIDHHAAQTPMAKSNGLVVAVALILMILSSVAVVVREGILTSHGIPLLRYDYDGKIDALTLFGGFGGALGAWMFIATTKKLGQNLLNGWIIVQGGVLVAVGVMDFCLDNFSKYTSVCTWILIMVHVLAYQVVEDHANTKNKSGKSGNGMATLDV